MMGSKGQVGNCSHCGSDGMCKRGSSSSYSHNDISCMICIKSAGFDPKEEIIVICSVCGGKKVYWVGPPTPAEVHEHTHEHTYEHTHTYEGGEIDPSVIEQLVESSTNLLDKFEEIVEQQSEILSRIADVFETITSQKAKPRSNKDA